MKQIKLPRFPSQLPDDVEVRDFDLGGGKYARVIMEMATIRDPAGVGHLELKAQAYEMDKSGHFKQAPLGYPSRSSTTTHTMILSSIGVTINVDDSWVEVSKVYDPEVGDLPTHKVVPKLGSEYGDEIWVVSTQRVYQWAEGFADVIARTKAQDMATVLKTSDVRSGFAFRNRRNKE